MNSQLSLLTLLYNQINIVTIVYRHFLEDLENAFLC